MTTAIWNFDSDAEGWSETYMAWSDTDGDPDPGCLLKSDFATPFKYVYELLYGTWPMTAGNGIRFRFRVRGTPGATVAAPAFRASDTYGTLYAEAEYNSGGFGVLTIPLGGDTGWVTVEGAVVETGTATELAVGVGSYDDVGNNLNLAAFDSLALDFPPGQTQLYSGTDALELVGDTPFEQVGAGGLAIRRDGAIAIGSGLGEPEQVAVWNGTDFTDITNDHPTGYPVRRLRWIE